MKFTREAKSQLLSQNVLKIPCSCCRMGKLSLQSKNLDELLGGGVEPGVISNFFGAPAAGKTNIALQLTVNCIRSGKKVIFIDTEGGFSTERFIQMHEKEALKDVILLHPMSFEEQDRMIKEMEKLFNKENNIGLIVVDSLVALYRLESYAKDVIQEKNAKLSKQLALLSKVARERNIPVIVTNQIYKDFDTDDIEIVGGDIPRYACKALVFLEKSATGRRRATLIRHRHLAEDEKAEFLIVNEGLADPKKLGMF